MGYPRRVLRISNIELTTFCNLRCRYCPSPKLEKIRSQPYQHMAMDIYGLALDWCRFYYERGTQSALYLHGVGETTMHPEFAEVIRLVREALPETDIGLVTNGVSLTEEHCEVLAEHGVWLNISLHRPEKAAGAVELALKHGVLRFTNCAPVERANNWAGNVEWYVAERNEPICDWLQFGMAYIAVDGRITTCCYDAACLGVIGHVSEKEKMGELEVAPFSLCATCHMRPPAAEDVGVHDPEWAQSKGATSGTSGARARPAEALAG